jgi:hypothetical protein
MFEHRDVDNRLSYFACHETARVDRSLTSGYRRIFQMQLGRDGSVMWIPTRKEAVELYACFCVAHYGVNALEKARLQARQLARQGDADGERIWGEVVCEIERTKPKNLPLSWSSGV